MAVGMTDVVQMARTELGALTGLEISSTVAVERTEDGWVVTLEVVEKHSIPDSMDILAIYETRLDPDGTMKEFKRIKMRKRIDTEDVLE